MNPIQFSVPPATGSLLTSALQLPEQRGELVSALVDGQLEGEDFAAAVQLCEHDEQARAGWDTYHWIGDVLRSSTPVEYGAERAFLQRLNERLADETLLAPHLRPASAEPNENSTSVGPDAKLPLTESPAANDGSFRWKLVAAFASLVGLSAVAWNAASLLPRGATSPQLAQAPAAQRAVVISSQDPMVRDARFEELLAAHNQLAGVSALQVPSGFLRNATFETPQDAGR